MVKKFRLKKHHEQSNIQKYLENAPFCNFKLNDWNQLSRVHNQTRPNKELGLKNKKLLDKIKRHPEDFFNFGFNLTDFATIL